MIATLTLTLLAEPQVPPEVRATPAVVVCGALREDGSLPLPRLGLGDGGLAPGSRLRVRAQQEGVKLDFPSGAELLVSASGFVHLRDGEQCGPFHRLELRATDETSVRIQVGMRRGDPLARVEIHDRESAQVVWPQNPAGAVEAAHRDFHGTTLLLLGDGAALYRPIPFGPMLILDRALCHKDLTRNFPERRVVIAGDLLAASLEDLPKAQERVGGKHPSLLLATRQLAELSEALFAPGYLIRPPGTVGALVLPLGGGYGLIPRLRDAQLVIGLCAQGQEVPLVEWITAARSELYLLRPGEGPDGGRPFGRPVDLTRGCERLLRADRSEADITRAREILVALGVRKS